MKKYLIWLGFLPMLAFADTTESLSPKDSLTEQVATKMYFEQMENFEPHQYNNQLKLYQNYYNASDKSELCLQTVERLTQQVEFQRQMNYDKIKNELVKPVVATLSDEQAKVLNTELKNYRNGKVSMTADNFGKQILQRANQLMNVNSKSDVNFGDLFKNCPAKNQ